MQSKWVVSVVLAAAVTLSSGCGLIEEDSTLLSFLGVVGDRAYFEYYNEYSGWVVLPSSIWEVDLTSGDTKKIAATGVRYDTQISDDFYVAERPTDDDKGSRIVAKRISTGEKTVVLERDVQLGGRYDRVFVLVGNRVVALTDDGLLVYDLAANQVENEIDVAGSLVELLAASDEWALVTLNFPYSADELLVNLSTGDVLTVPAMANGQIGLFFDAAFADDYMFTASLPSDEAQTDTRAVQALHIPTLTWSVLADYGESSSVAFAPATLVVTGADDTHVLAQHSVPFRQARLDLISRTSGERQEIDQSTGFNVGPWCAHLCEGRVYWIDDGLVVHDLASGERATTPLNVPN